MLTLRNLLLGLYFLFTSTAFAAGNRTAYVVPFQWPDGDGDVIANITLLENLRRDKIDTTLLLDINRLYSNRDHLIEVVARTLQDTEHGDPAVAQSLRNFLTAQTAHPDLSPLHLGVNGEVKIGRGLYEGVKIRLYDPKREIPLPKKDIAISFSRTDASVEQIREYPPAIADAVKGILYVGEPTGAGPTLTAQRSFRGKPLITLSMLPGEHYFVPSAIRKPRAFDELIHEANHQGGELSGLSQDFITPKTKFFHSYVTNQNSAVTFVKQAIQVAEKDPASRYVILVNHDENLFFVPDALKKRVQVVRYNKLSHSLMSDFYQSSTLASATGDNSFVQMLQTQHFPFIYEVRSHKTDFIRTNFSPLFFAQMDRALTAKGKPSLTTEERDLLARALFLPENGSLSQADAFQTLSGNPRLLSAGREAMNARALQIPITDRLVQRVLPALDHFEPFALAIVLDQHRELRDPGIAGWNRLFESDPNRTPKETLDLLDNTFQNDKASPTEIVQSLALMAASKRGLTGQQIAWILGIAKEQRTTTDERLQKQLIEILGNALFHAEGENRSQLQTALRMVSPLWGEKAEASQMARQLLSAERNLREFTGTSDPLRKIEMTNELVPLRMLVTFRARDLGRFDSARLERGLQNEEIFEAYRIKKMLPEAYLKLRRQHGSKIRALLSTDPNPAADASALRHFESTLNEIFDPIALDKTLASEEVRREVEWLLKEYEPGQPASLILDRLAAAVVKAGDPAEGFDRQRLKPLSVLFEARSKTEQEGLLVMGAAKFLAKRKRSCGPAFGEIAIFK